jgi:catechol 2,3-dioxygenase-like lactoylglutathione lyase family enzyme
MKQKLAHIAILVDDYDKAIDFYTRVMGFELVEDTVLSDTKRWVRVAPAGDATGCCLLLARAADEAQARFIGNQSGGRVFLFLHTDNFQRDYERLLSFDVVFVRGPVQEPYGQVAVFKDIYGNLWDLIQPSK